VVEANDPAEGFNRAIFNFNRVFDDLFISPAVTTYETVVPKPVRSTATRFTDNLLLPGRAVNELLQADLADAKTTSGRFVVNTTLGVGGLFDPATGLGLERLPEDFGQTLGNWGVADGPYLVLPLLGPTTARGAVGSLGNLALSPIILLGVPSGTGSQRLFATERALSTRLMSDEQIERIYASDEAYAILRSLYVQQQAAQLHEDADPYENLPDFD
jgi:phospholipid-binding lipoprotein MlaA